MHHDAHTAQMVRQTCIEMLTSYPSEEFVLVTLKTLTRLSAHTLVDVPEQVELLLKYLNEDPRKSVKRQILCDLRFLATDQRAHLWSASNVDSVVSFATQCLQDEGEVLVGSLSILCDIIRHTSTSKLKQLQQDSPIIKLAQSCCYSNRLTCAARSTQLITLLAIHCLKDHQQIPGLDISSEAVMAIEALFLLINSEGSLQRESSSSRMILKECLICVVLLCQVQPGACDQFVDIVGGMLLTSSRETVLLLCETLASFASIKSGVIKLLMPDICHAINTVIESEVDTGSTAPVLTLLTTLLFQTLKGHSWPDAASGAIRNAVGNVDQWSAYCIGRSASRYGHHGVASEIFDKLTLEVSSEHFYFWLSGLTQISKGEHILNDVNNNDLIDRLSFANAHILEGLTSIRASSTPTRNQEFQVDYLRCRSDFLQTLGQLVFTCHSLRTSPPPAIASSQAKASADDLQRCGRVTGLLRGCVSDFANVSAAFNNLYSMSFDGDKDTLAQIHIMQHLCLCLSQWIEMVCLKSSRQGNIYEDLTIAFTPSLISEDESKTTNIEIQDLLSVGEQVAECFRRLVANPDTPQPITDAHTTCLLDVTSLLTSCQMGLPRLFYQSLQNTSLKLAVTPQPRLGNEPIGVSNAQHMAIKVEGVITTSSSIEKPLRKVKFIKLTLTSQLLNASAKVIQSGEKLPDCNQTLEHTAEPHNDFFLAQFLIPFPVAGTHQVLLLCVSKKQCVQSRKFCCLLISIFFF
jgi:integrator complex subunit 7